MRQFFTWQFWVAIVGLVVALGAALIVRDRATSNGLDLERALEPAEHRIDLIAPVLELRAAAGFRVVDGVARGDLTVVLDAGRRVTILGGTPGESRCTLPVTEGADPCLFAADLLGESVVWFSLVPSVQRTLLIDLPPIVELRDDRWTLLRNGWEVQRATLVERSCPNDTTSLGEFVRKFGPTSVTTFNLARQEIVKVTCAGP